MGARYEDREPDMTRIEIRTEDTAWAAEHSTPGRDGRVVVSAEAVERVTFAGQDMVRFDLGTALPSDWWNRYAMVPASWVV